MRRHVLILIAVWAATTGAAFGKPSAAWTQAMAAHKAKDYATVESICAPLVGDESTTPRVRHRLGADASHDRPAW